MNYEQIKGLLPGEARNQRAIIRVQKAMRDTDRIRRHAHFVIVLGVDEQHGPYCREFIDNTERGYVANVIAVLAPVDLFDGWFVLEQSVVLEVGLTRGRPYTQAESSLGAANRRLVVKKRHKLRDATFDEVAGAWPRILECIKEETRRLQGGRMYPNTFLLRGRNYIHDDGIRVTVSKNDRYLYWKIVIEDERARIRRYIGDRAAWITSQLMPYTRTTVRGKRFKNLAGVRAATGTLQNMRAYTYMPNHLIRKLVVFLPKDVRNVFNEVVDVYKLSWVARVQQQRPRLPTELKVARQLPPLTECFMVIKRKQGRMLLSRESGRRRRQIDPTKRGHPHAQGCVVAELYFKERLS